MTARTILVVAAHPDDEVLGCGATLARHAAEGDRVHVLIAAEGATSRDARRDKDARAGEVAALRAAAGRAAAALGIEPPRFLGLPDNRLDELPLLDAIKPIEAVIDELAPDIVYTHHGGDLNVDHRIVHQAVLTACRPLPGRSVHGLYAFETVSSTEWGSPALGEMFRPTHFVDCAAHMARKQAALDCYAAEMRPFPHARSHDNVAALARHRGASVGMEAAEAFVTLYDLRHGN